MKGARGPDIWAFGVVLYATSQWRAWRVRAAFTSGCAEAGRTSTITALSWNPSIENRTVLGARIPA